MVQSFLDGVAALGNETRALIVEDVCKKLHSLSDREKHFLFNYLKEGDMNERDRVTANNTALNLKINENIASYKTNVYLIVESFFNYGFIPLIIEECEEFNMRRSGSTNLMDTFRESLSSVSSHASLDLDTNEDYREA